MECPPSSKTCGIANVLQFSNGKNGQTWFTELSENKIGSIATSAYFSNNHNGSHQLPFSISTSPIHLTIKRGQSVEIKVNISSGASLRSDINMVSSGTFTPTAILVIPQDHLVNNPFR